MARGLSCCVWSMESSLICTEWLNWTEQPPQLTTTPVPSEDVCTCSATSNQGNIFYPRTLVPKGMTKSLKHFSALTDDIQSSLISCHQTTKTESGTINADTWVCVCLHQSHLTSSFKESSAFGKILFENKLNEAASTSSGIRNVFYDWISTSNLLTNVRDYHVSWWDEQTHTLLCVDEGVFSED